MDFFYNSKACFKRRATAVPNSIDRIKFNFSIRATAVLHGSSSTLFQTSRYCRAEHNS